jgi:hypothetical protein
MKKVALFALLTGAIFVSCSDDDSTAVNNVSLIGTWKLTALNGSEPIDLNGDGTPTTDMVEETGCYDGSTIVFSADNTAVLTMEEANITLDGSMTPVITCDMLDPISGTYTENGNEVTITMNGEAGTAIKSGNTLTITEAGDEEQLGGTLIFTKQ